MKLNITLLVTFLLFSSTLLRAQNPNAQLVRDLTPGPASTFSGGDDDIVGHVRDRLLFTVVDNDYISHLYSSMGTPTTTVELETGASQSVHFREFVKVNADTIAYVLYDQNALTYKLYWTDGYSLGLLDAHDEDIEISNLKYQNGKLVYNSRSQIRTIDLNNTTDQSVFDASPNSLVDFYFDGPGTLYYGVKAEENNQDDTLYVYDVEDGFTSLGAIGESIAWGLNFQKVNGKILLFNKAMDGLSYFYSTDGTLAGTSLLKKFAWQGSGLCNVQLIKGNQLYFDAALDPTDPEAGYVELFASDGTVSGTYSLSNSISPFKDPKTLVEYNDRIYFQATSVDQFYPYLYTSDGSVASATNVGLKTYFGAEGLVVFGNTLFVTTDLQTYGVGITTFNDIDQPAPGDVNSYFYDLSKDLSSTLDYVSSLYATEEDIYFVGRIQDDVGRELFLFQPNTPAIVTSTTQGQASTQDLSFYPNPATDHVSLDYTGSDKLVSVQLRDINGRLVREFKEMQTLDVSGLEQGMYCVDIRFEHSQRMMKLVKK